MHDIYTQNSLIALLKINAINCNTLFAFSVLYITDAMYKALITDLDGSAVNITSNGSDIDEQTRLAVAAAQAKGYHISCATGRQWSSTKPVVEALGITSLCVINGGSAIINPVTEEIVWEQPLTTGTPSKILAIFKAHTASGEVYMPAEPFKVTLTEINEVPEDLRYLYLIGVPSEDARLIAQEVNMSNFAVSHLTPSWSGGDFIDIHVTHPDATKEHAVKVWQELEGVTTEQTIGIGDSGNDMPLFRASGLKVAVGNATDELKTEADYVAPAVSDYALKHVIDKFLLSQ